MSVINSSTWAFINGSNFVMDFLLNSVSINILALFLIAQKPRYTHNMQDSLMILLLRLHTFLLRYENTANMTLIHSAVYDKK